MTTTLLDRIIHRAEIIHGNGDNYRMKYRTSTLHKKWHKK
ncbi:hypothetical protein [Weizmannia acidilactici]|nr:hypothetical protein [Weizmannia acidilactici]